MTSPSLLVWERKHENPIERCSAWHSGQADQLLHPSSYLLVRRAHAVDRPLSISLAGSPEKIVWDLGGKKAPKTTR